MCVTSVAVGWGVVEKRGLMGWRVHVHRFLFRRTQEDCFPGFLARSWALQPAAEPGQCGGVGGAVSIFGAWSFPGPRASCPPFPCPGDLASTCLGWHSHRVERAGCLTHSVT